MFLFTCVRNYNFFFSLSLFFCMYFYKEIEHETWEPRNSFWEAGPHRPIHGVQARLTIKHSFSREYSSVIFFILFYFFLKLLLICSLRRESAVRVPESPLTRRPILRNAHVFLIASPLKFFAWKKSRGSLCLFLFRICRVGFFLFFFGGWDLMR